MTRWHVEALFFEPSSRSRCITRLRYFANVGIIKRLEQPSIFSEGRKPFVYVACEKTAQLVATKDKISIEDIEWDGRELQAGNLFLPHLLAITDVNVAFTLAAKKHGFTIETWLHTLMLKRKGMIDRVEVTGPRGATQKISVEPDVFTILDDTVHKNNLFLEIDRGTEDRQEIANKIYAYRYYMTPLDDKPSVYEQRYGTRKGRILFIALTERRVLTLKEITEACGGRARFWFATLPDIQNNDPFMDTIWRKAGTPNDEKFTLIW